jgi:hypothetical protein
MPGSPNQGSLVRAENMYVEIYVGTQETCLLSNGEFNDTVSGEMTNGNLIFINRNSVP